MSKPAAKRKSHARKHQLLAELRRSEILASAMAVFGNKGFSGTRMDDIARQADLAKGTLYLYFRSKQEIYNAAVQQAVSDLHALTRERVGAAKNIQAQLEAFVSVRVTFWEEKRDLYRIVLSMTRDSARRRQNMTWQKETVRYLSSVLAAAVARNEIPAQDVEAGAWAIFDMVRGANERRLMGDVPPSSGDAHFVALFALSALGGYRR